MTCPEFTALLSSRIDGELSPSQRIRLEAHLQGCADCRRDAERMERTVAWVRGLERLPAPPLPAQLAGASRSRRSAWDTLRPLALAASAVLAALLAWEGFQALVAPAPSTATAPAAPAQETGVPRRSTASEAYPPAPSRPSAGAPAGPAAVASEGGAGSDSSPGATGPASRPPVVSPQGTTESGETNQEEPAYARISGRPPAVAEEAPEGDPDDTAPAGSPPSRGGTGATDPGGSAPAATIAWIVPPAAAGPNPPGTTPPAAGAVRPATASQGRLAPAPGNAPAPAAATEVAISVPVIAWADADAVRFEDPGEAIPGDLDRAPDPEASGERAPDADLLRRGVEISRPAADPRTGVTPPVAVDRPQLVLPTAPDPEAWRLLPPLSLRVTVATDGRVVNVSPLPWPGPRPVEEALARSVRGWTFLPAEFAGAAIAVRLEVAIEFDAR